MIINVSAGHAPDGGIGSGAVGFCKESTEARKIVPFVIDYLEKAGHTVYDCTCNMNVDRETCLKKIVKKHNEHKADLGVSIHLNCYKKTRTDGVTTGSEVLVLSESGDQFKMKAANRILNKLEDAGFKNRGIKERPGLYVLKYTNEPCILVEVYFCDDEDDYLLASDLGAKKLGKMIAEGIHGKSIDEHVVKAGDKVTAIQALKIRSSCKSDYVQLGSIYKGTVLPVLKVSGDYAMFADGLWVKCTEKCVKVH